VHKNNQNYLLSENNPTNLNYEINPELNFNEKKNFDILVNGLNKLSNQNLPNGNLSIINPFVYNNIEIPTINSSNMNPNFKITECNVSGLNNNKNSNNNIYNENTKVESNIINSLQGLNSKGKLITGTITQEDMFVSKKRKRENPKIESTDFETSKEIFLNNGINNLNNCKSYNIKYNNSNEFNINTEAFNNPINSYPKINIPFNLNQKNANLNGGFLNISSENNIKSNNYHETNNTNNNIYYNDLNYLNNLFNLKNDYQNDSLSLLCQKQMDCNIPLIDAENIQQNANNSLNYLANFNNCSYKYLKNFNNNPINNKVYAPMFNNCINISNKNYKTNLNDNPDNSLSKNHINKNQDSYFHQNLNESSVSKNNLNIDNYPIPTGEISSQNSLQQKQIFKQNNNHLELNENMNSIKNFSYAPRELLLQLKGSNLNATCDQLNFINHYNYMDNNKPSLININFNKINKNESSSNSIENLNEKTKNSLNELVRKDSDKNFILASNQIENLNSLNNSFNNYFNKPDPMLLLQLVQGNIPIGVLDLDNTNNKVNDISNNQAFSTEMLKNINNIIRSNVEINNDNNKK